MKPGETRTRLSCLSIPPRAPAAALLLALALVLTPGGVAWAQGDPGICSNTPEFTAAKMRVSCIETDSADDIELNLNEITISTTKAGQAGKAVEVWQTKTSGGTSTGDIDVDFTNGSITTTGKTAPGIDATIEGTGDISINVEDSTISTSFAGVYGTANANIDIDVSDSTITTTESSADGVGGQIAQTGDLDIDLEDTDVTTSGTTANGVAGYFFDQGGANPTGTLDIGIVRGTISTSGQAASYAVYATHEGEGDIKVNINGATIKTTGATITDDTDPNYNLPSNGVNAWHQGATTSQQNRDGNIDIRLTNTSISTADAMGVYAWREDNGNVDIRFTGGSISTGSSSVSTDGRSAHGIYGILWTRAETNAGTGTLLIEGRNSDITTNGVNAFGVWGLAYDTTTTTFKIDLQNVNIKTESTDPWSTDDPNTYGYGVFGRHLGADKLVINARGGSVSTKGRFSPGLYALHQGTGDIAVTAGGRHSITTAGRSGYGIYGRHLGTGDIAITTGGGSSVSTTGRAGYGIYARHEEVGAIRIEGRNSDITTTGLNALGVYGYAFDATTTTLEIDLQNVRIKTESTALWDADTDPYTYAYGVYGRHKGANNLDINVRGGSVSTKGGISYGIYGRHEGTGDIAIRTGGGLSVTTEGDFSHGILAYHYGTQEARTILIDVGSGTVTATGDGALGVRAGTTNDDGEVILAAGFDDDDYRRQTVTVNGRVQGSRAGVYLAGGGRVVIGPRGRIRGDSGVAILASGDTPGESPSDPATKPKLRVDLNLGGRRVSSAIGDDWIINDGGETTIAVNNVVLHEGATGVVEGAVARNGAWDVRMLAEGVKVTDRTDPDPANWVVSDPAEDVIADRDFSAGDFNERFERPPPPPTCPAGQVGTPPNCMTPPPPMCPEGQVGTPPNCMTPPPPMCPEGQVGTPPNCMTPPPPMCPEGQVGTPPNCMTPPKRVFEGSGNVVAVFQRSAGRAVRNVFDGLLDAAADYLTASGEPVAGVPATRVSSNIEERYAPRAAVYEALPGFLLRLDGGGPEGARLRSPGSPVWAKLTGGRGSYESDSASAGAEYDFNRFTAQVGLDAGMGEYFAGSISVRQVSGSAEVSAPTGGGEVDAKGIGVSLGASWKGAGGYYANGSLSLTDYDLELADSSVGTLKKDASARGLSLGIEAGQRIRMSRNTSLTPRAWATRSAVSIDNFTDSADARFSLDDARRLTGGVGVAAETARAFEGGTLSLRGSVDVEQVFGDAETSVDVSGERLASEAAGTRLLLGLGGVYRKGRFSISGEVSVGGPGSGDAEYAGRVSIGIRF